MDCLFRKIWKIYMKKQMWIWVNVFTVNIKQLSLIFFLWASQYLCALNCCLKSIFLCNLKTTLTVDHFYDMDNLFISLGGVVCWGFSFLSSPPGTLNTLKFSCSTIFGLMEIAATWFWHRNTSMAFQMIYLHILILQILVICLFIELVVGHRPHAQPCPLEQNLLQIQQELYL